MPILIGTALLVLLFLCQLMDSVQARLEAFPDANDPSADVDVSSSLSSTIQTDTNGPAEKQKTA